MRKPGDKRFEMFRREFDVGEQVYRSPEPYPGRPEEAMPPLPARRLLDELVALRGSEPSRAFDRLMAVVRVGPAAARPVFGAGLVDRAGTLFVDAAPDFLRAIAASGAVDVSVHLFEALTHERLDIAAVPSELFDNLSQLERADLLRRLASHPLDANGDDRLRPAIAHVLLSDPDIESLVSAAEALFLWNRLPAVPLLRRLIEQQRYVPMFPFLVVRALMEGEREGDRVDLLNRSLSFCEERGKDDIAQQIRFKLFKETLGVPFAREWLRNLPADMDPAAEEDHVLVRVHSDRRTGRALLFLLQWPAHVRAVELVRTTCSEMDDVEVWQLSEAADHLAEAAPGAALKLYRLAAKPRSMLDVHPTARFHNRKPPWYAAWPSG